MEISLKDQIVVLDEAHNVEDSARDAASLTLTAVDLQNTLDDLDRLGNKMKIVLLLLHLDGQSVDGWWVTLGDDGNTHIWLHPAYL